jgi:hypothetical protein
VDEAPVFTARMAAAMRAAHCLIDDPPVFSDELALPFCELTETEVRDLVGVGDQSYASVFG